MVWAFEAARVARTASGTEELPTAAAADQHSKWPAKLGGATLAEIRETVVKCLANLALLYEFARNEHDELEAAACNSALDLVLAVPAPTDADLRQLKDLLVREVAGGDNFLEQLRYELAILNAPADVMRWGSVDLLSDDEPAEAPIGPAARGAVATSDVPSAVPEHVVVKSAAPRCRKCRGAGVCQKCWDLPGDLQACKVCRGTRDCDGCGGSGEEPNVPVHVAQEDSDGIPF